MTAFGTLSRLDIFWSVNKFARAITKWTSACGSAFDLLHSSHMSIQTILLCGKHSITKQIRIVSRL